MKRLEDKIYNFGDARKRAFQERGLAASSNSFEKAFYFEQKHFPRELIFSDFRQYHFWAAHLIEAAQKIDDQFDELMNEVIVCGDSWYDERSRRLLVVDLNTLLARRESVRDLEREAEVYMNAIAAVDFAKGNEHQVAVTALAEALRQMHETYARIFDLCTLKLNTIWNRRLTYATFFIAISALFVAILTLLNQ